MEKNEKPSLTTALANFLSRSRVLLIVSGCAVLVVLAVIVVVQQVSDSAVRANASILDSIDMAYSDWSAASDETVRTANAEALEKLLAVDESASVSVREYALFVKGNYLSGKSSWKDAAAAYTSASLLQPGSFLHPVSVFCAAAALEEAGDADGAIVQLQQIATPDASVSTLTVRAWFSLGRLFESKGKTGDARNAYQHLVDTWPDSSWTKLARDRIIFLDVTTL